jgi:hypothetical protein
MNPPRWLGLETRRKTQAKINQLPLAHTQVTKTSGRHNTAAGIRWRFLVRLICRLVDNDGTRRLLLHPAGWKQPSQTIISSGIAGLLQTGPYINGSHPVELT